MYGMALSVVIGGACVVARVVLWTNVWFRWWFAIGGGLGVLVWGLAHFGVKDMKDAAEEGGEDAGAAAARTRTRNEVGY